MENKQGQIAIFIIIGIVIVGGVVSFFVFRDKITSTGIPSNMQPIYSTFLSCLEEKTTAGIEILESQGGYIELPDFEQGSEYSPFGSQMNFLGNPIPYWYYVSGNNLQKEQVPSKTEMEEHLADFVDGKIRNCVFDDYYLQGFEINQGEPKASVNINEKSVSVDLKMDLSIEKGEDVSVVKSHKIEVKSYLGKLYDDAKKIYEKEQNELFLEEYAVDNLRLYAPVDGVELTCSPLVWNADEVFENLSIATETNTLALKNSDGLFNKENKYFLVDAEVDSNVRFVTSKNWAGRFEVEPSEGGMMISKPVGNQPGLGILGFCYVPYHYVYNIDYSILVQVYSGDNSEGTDEIFQFPVAVVLRGNNPRESLDVSAVETESPQLCEYKNTLAKVRTYDAHLNPVEAEISYECFSETCSIGKTKAGFLEEKFPQCANGYIVASAENFKRAKYLYSTMEEGSAEIILDRVYEKEIKLKLDGRDYNGDAIIYFSSDGSSEVAVYLQQKKVRLNEGQYEITAYIYRNSSLNLGARTQKQCFEVPKSGIGSLIGMTDEKCFDIEIPSQIVSNALAGGGKENYYILESELQNSDAVEINAQSLPTPVSLEQLQENYVLFETKNLGVLFR